MLGRDSELRRVWWAVTGNDPALGNRGKEIAAAMAGPGDMVGAAQGRWRGGGEGTEMLQTRLPLLFLFDTPTLHTSPSLFAFNCFCHCPSLPKYCHTFYWVRGSAYPPSVSPNTIPVLPVSRIMPSRKDPFNHYPRDMSHASCNLHKGEKSLPERSQFWE